MPGIDTLKHITYIPLDNLTRPHEGQVMADRWWIVDPEKGALVYKKFAPQCNRDEMIARRILDMYPGCVVRHIEFAYVGNMFRD
jgi:hypothetical protein